jgi:broad specificity phosphatase PhoE
MTELLLIRHGESEANIGRSADPDCSLSDLGLEQAQKLAKRLSRYDLGDFLALTSPYRRAIQTAEEIALATGLQFVIEDSIREWGETATISGRLYEKESKEDLILRLSKFLRHVHGTKLVIVSHASPIALLSQLAWGEPPNPEGEFWSAIAHCCPRWLKVTRDWNDAINDEIQITNDQSNPESV